MQGRVSLLARALTLAILVMLAAACAARADTLTVTGTGEDGGPCAAGLCPSIRSALGQAAALPGADTIVVPAGEYFLSNALTVGSDVTLRGASARTTILHGGGTYRVFEVAFGVTATISHLTMRDGTADNGNGCWGGNLRSEGTLLLDHIRSTAGRACSGAGLGNVGAAMTVQSSLIDSNNANIGGSDSGGILNLGRQDRPAQLTVRDTTIAFNQAVQTGGVFSWSYEGNIPNATTLDRVTLAYNGGGALRRADASQTFTVRGSIVQGACAGGIVSGGSNFESGSSCGFETQDDNALVSDALIPMGGETDVLAAGSSTAWIDAAGACTGTDQRDVTRPQGVACDAGAVELDTVAPGAPVITSADSGMLTGTAEPLATIEVLDGGTSIGTTTAGADGAWRFPIPADGRHTYTARATDAAGNTSPQSAPRTVGADVAQATPTPTPTPTPVPGKTVVGAPVRGKVLVKVPGKGFVELDATQSIPLGSTIDTKKGTISLTAKTGQTATFHDGIFKITQTKSTTDLTLTEALAPCRGARIAAKKPKTRKLWGNGSGSFRTRGQYSAATVRGTEWLVQDSCAGTLTQVKKGVVTVRDNVKKKTIILRAGKKYLARPRR